MKLENHLLDCIEGMFIELNLKKTKWLLYWMLSSTISQYDDHFFYHIMNDLNKLSQKCSKYILVGDFNAEDSETCLSSFFLEINAKNIVKNYTCSKVLKIVVALILLPQ